MFSAKNKSFYRRGSTLMEVVVAIGIIVLLLAISFGPLKNFNSAKALEIDASRVAGELSRARSLTLGSKNGSSYGLFFENNKVTLFPGTTYVSGLASNTSSYLNPLVKINSVGLAGGSPSVVFKRLTGETDQNGTITLSSVTSPAQTKTITIYSTGVYEIN